MTIWTDRHKDRLIATFRIITGPRTIYIQTQNNNNYNNYTTQKLNRNLKMF